MWMGETAGILLRIERPKGTEVDADLRMSTSLLMDPWRLRQPALEALSLKVVDIYSAELRRAKAFL